MKITAASSTKTSDPDKKTKEPDGNEDDEDSSGGMVVQQDTQSQVLGKFVTNLLLLAVAFILVLVAMAGQHHRRDHLFPAVDGKQRSQKSYSTP